MYAIFCEAIAKFSLDTAACLMTSMFTISNIVYHGTPEQQAEHIPAFLKGERRFSISISEPSAGSDAAAISTKAVEDGDDWVLNGNKTWCSGAHLPGAWIVMTARTGPERHDGLWHLPDAEHGRGPGHPQDADDRPPQPGHHRDLPDRRARAQEQRHRRDRQGLGLHGRAPGLRAPRPGRVLRRQRPHRARRHDRLHQEPHRVRPAAVQPSRCSSTGWPRTRRR